MSVETDQLLQRRRLRRSLAVWRALAVVAVVAAGAGIAWALAGGSWPGRVGDQIARIEISGPILSDRPLLEMIEKIGKNDGVKGVLVAINSPGGSTVGGESLYKTLRTLAEKKPVVAQIDTIGTSAGYMIALAGDRIFSWRTSITGSIGVLIQYGQVDELLDNIGVEVGKVDSGPLKAEPNPFEPIEPDAVAMLQSVVDDSYDWFVALVAERRDLELEAALQLADGRIMTGHQAVESGLVDEIGGEDAAVAWLERERGVETDLPVRTWKPARPSEGGFLGAVAERIAARMAAALGLDELERLGRGIGTGTFVDGLKSLWQGPTNGAGRLEEATPG